MKRFLRVIITLILLGVIIWVLGGIGEVGRLMARMDPLYAVLVFGIATVSRMLMTFKWQQLLRGQGLHLPFFRGLRIYCASNIWGMFLPVTVGGDAIRAIVTSRMGFDPNVVVASIVIERMLGFLSALLLGLLSFFLLSFLNVIDARFDFVWWLGAGALASFTIAFAASFSQAVFDLVHRRLLVRFQGAWIMQKFRELHSTYQAYQKNRGVLFAFFILTIVEQLTAVLSVWLVARGLTVEVGLLVVAGVLPLTVLIGRLPISIHGWGVVDGIFALLMSLAGVAPAQSVAIVLIARILQTASWLPWWMAEVITSGGIRPPRALADRG